jgi:hypothetical protein
MSLKIMKISIKIQQSLSNWTRFWVSSKGWENKKVFVSTQYRAAQMKRTDCSWQIDSDEGFGGEVNNG